MGLIHSCTTVAAKRFHCGQGKAERLHWRRECWRHLWSGPVRALGGSLQVRKDVPAAA